MSLRRNPFVRVFSSLKLTVVCLALLFILTAWGTIYQTDFGLYPAQERFFHSWFFFIYDLIPFPGAQLVMWVLAINLFVAAIPRILNGFQQFGLVLIHAGLIIMLLGGFLTYYFAQESVLSLKEGEEQNVSSDYRAFELSVWEKPQSGQRKVHSVDSRDFEVGVPFRMPNLPAQLTIENFEANSRPQRNPNLEVPLINASGLNSLVALEPDPDPGQNYPGIILSVAGPDDEKKTLLLHGMEIRPTEIELGGVIYGFALRRLRHPLPLSIKLIDFVKEDHPGTSMASNYESTVEIDTGTMRRKVRIFMNNPLRYKDFTFFQSSFSINRDGTENSVFSVVENKGRLFPYISCAIIGFGLLFHFIVQLVRYIQNTQPPTAPKS